MKPRCFAAPALWVSVALGLVGLALWPAGCRAQVAALLASTSTLATSTAPVCDAVRISPRAGFAARMVGGEIQGSNESATGGFVTLALIQRAPREGEWTRIAFRNARAFRFLRYFGPDNSYTNVAEIQFLSRSQVLGGTPYGTFGSRDNKGNDFSKAFDGDTATFFDAAAANAQYVGIDTRIGLPVSVASEPVVLGNGLRSFHIGNSLTDGMGEYTQQIAMAAGFKDHWMDRQTIPGAPIWLNYKSDGGFGTNHKIAFEKFAPISDLVLQTFISNGDSPDPEFTLKFYDDARVKSPAIRPWIYGQWDAIGSSRDKNGAAAWEARTTNLMRTYIAHASNFNAVSKDKKAQVIPGGLALINLSKAFEAGKIPGLPDFFAANFNDDLHLTEAGRQFIGMVTFASLYNKSPVGLPVVKINDNAPKLTPEQNKAYQQVAWDTVQSFRKDGGASVGLVVPVEIDARLHVQGSTPIRGSRLNYINEKSSFLYVLNAPKAGRYDFRVSAWADRADEKLEVFLNNVALGALTIKKDDKQPLLDTAPLPIELKAGLNVLRLFVPTNRPYDLNSVKITPVGQELKNTMPVFDFNVWEDDVKPGESYTRDFSVSDAQTPGDKSDTLVVTATSDNTALVPNENIKIESGEFKGQWGQVSNRRISVTPVAGQIGEANIMVTVEDADKSRRAQSFKIKVK